MTKKLAIQAFLVALLLSFLATPVLTFGKTATTTPSIIDLACMQTAVEKYDNAIIAAWDKRSADVKTALQTRRDALKSAWGIQDKKERRAAIKAAEKAYRTAIAQARKTFKSERQAAWKQFIIDRRACGPEAAVDDATTYGLDASL
jgi:hypothetical protein